MSKMGFTIEDAIAQTGKQYQLQLLAGQKGCANSISWVHMIEDTTIIQQLWGKELAVTTGLGFQTQDTLMAFVKKLIQYHCVGLIINTGKYIIDIPLDIIEYCEKHNFPLLTTPWEIHMADLIKDFSMRCLSSEREDLQISKYFKEIFMNPKKIDEEKEHLLEVFDVNGYFQVILIGIEHADEYDMIEKRKIALQLELCFEKVDSPYSFFWYDGYFVMIVNNLDVEELEKVIDNMYQQSKKRMQNHYIHIGVGTRMLNLRNVILSYQRAYAAVQMATQFQYPMMYFEEMGVFQILFSVNDFQILENMYHQLLDPLIEYDQKHHGELEMTFYYYLLYDGHHQAMSKHLYMHRNTINYRLAKIKELLGSDLSSFEEKMPYMLAFYIKKMLQKK